MKTSFTIAVFLYSILCCFNLSAQQADCPNYDGINVTIFEPEICAGGEVFFEFEFVNQDPDGSFYFIEASGSDGSTGSGDGDGFFGFITIPVNPIDQCTPVTVDYFANVFCETGILLEQDVFLGTVQIYPNLLVEIVPPGCGVDENGSATLVTETGTICQGPIEGVAGAAGACDEQKPGSLSYSFEAFLGTFCETTYQDDLLVSCSTDPLGCTDATACNFDPDATCDDGSCDFNQPCCPLPVFDEIVPAICSSDGGPSELCISFDGDIAGLTPGSAFIENFNGDFGFEISADPVSNEVCFELFTFNPDCEPLDAEFFINYECANGDFNNYSLGIISIYPELNSFQPSIEPPFLCGGAPEIFGGPCGDILIGVETPPDNDCDVQAPGSIEWTIDPLFDITDAPACFVLPSGPTPIAPCADGCTCDGVLCGNTCLDLTVIINGPLEPACSFEETLIDITVEGTGADFGNYIIEIFGNNDFIGVYFHNTGDPTTFEVSAFLDNTSCIPTDVELSYNVICGDDGSTIITDIIGNITVYPNIGQFFPEEGFTEPCAPLQILPAPCGTVTTDPDPIPAPECGIDAQDQFIPWTTDVGFDVTDAPACFDVSQLQGEFFIPACFLGEGEPCELPCLGMGTIVDCECTVTNSPTVELVGDLPFGACADEPINLDINVIGTLGTDPIEVVIRDANFNLFTSVLVDQNTTLPVTLELFPFSDDPCNVSEYDLFLEARCTFDFSLITGPEILGTITIFPDLQNFEPLIIPGQACGDLPVVTPNDFCGGDVTTNITLPVDECDAPVAGSIDWTLVPPFDITNAPACFTDGLMGSTPIAPCLDGCPCDGTQCGGSCLDLTVNVNALLEPTCAFAGEVIEFTVSGLGADFGEYLIEINANNSFVGFGFHNAGDPTTFEVEMFFNNQDCTPTDYELTYNIICNVDGTVLLSDIIGNITVYPDVSLFFPEEGFTEPCSPLQILPAPCGTVVTDPDPIPSPECGPNGQDQFIPWTVDVGFDITDAPACFDVLQLEGEFFLPACPSLDGEPCDLPCLGPGTIIDCLCTVPDPPVVEFVGTLPQSVCEFEPISIDINVTGTLPADPIEIIVRDAAFNLFSSIFVDQNTAFPVTIDLFPFLNDPCNANSFEILLEARCNFDFSLIYGPEILGTVEVFPNPFNFTPNVTPGQACGDLPIVELNNFCTGTLTTDLILPVDDCDAPVAGSIDWVVTPDFDVTNAPTCFTDQLSGSVAIAPCLINCPCDGAFCNGTCLDLMANFGPLVSEVCPDQPFQIDLDLTGQGADFGDYFISIESGGFGVGFINHFPGDPTVFTVDLFPFNNTCLPELQDLTYNIFCNADGTLLASGSIGSYTVYPSPFNFFPQITPSVACVQELEIIAPLCGTLVLDPVDIPSPGCGGADETVDWSVDFGFDYPVDCFVEPVSGTETVFACAGTPGDPCDDGNPCTSNDVLDPDCNCVGEGPTVSTNDVLPTSGCTNDQLSFTATITGDIPDPDGLFVIINDQFGNTPAFGFLNPGDGNTIQLDIFLFTQNACESTVYDYVLELRCPATFGLIGTPIPLGSITVYPSLDQFIPTIEPAVECGQEPIITANFCGDLITNVTNPDPVSCPIGTDGFVDWMIDTGLDLTDAPACFDATELSGQEPITACGNCCPELLQAVVSEPGIYCAGDITEFCADFAEPFTTDGQVEINGVSAVAGESQICFDLELENTTCSFADFEVPIEVFCSTDNSIANVLSEPVSIAPDPNNWQFEIISGGCGFAPFINTINSSQCFAFVSEIITVTDPVDGCPPTEGEVELVIGYWDDNFIEIDLSQFTCPGFTTSVLALQPGCTDCSCPQEPLVSSFETDVCEDGTVEVCLEFQPGDEANAVGTFIEVSVNTGTFFSQALTGDGTSLEYCINFNPNNIVNVNCDPVTEDFFVNVLCNDFSPIVFNLGPFQTTLYPTIDKFAYEVSPAIDNCPGAATLPEVISTGECDLDIQSSVTTAPIDDCPETAGEFTYSVNYLNPADFANAPADCAFVSAVNATEPIPACSTCVDCFGSISGAITVDDDCDGTGGDIPTTPITVELYDAAGNLVTTVTTDATGTYLFDQIPCDNYDIVVVETTLPPCPQTTPTNPIASVTVNDGDDIVNQDFPYEPVVPVACNGVVEFADAEACSDSDTTVLVTSPQVVCNVNPEVINADGTLTIVSLDIYQIDPTGANPPGFLGSIFESATFGTSACTDLAVSYPANQTCEPITYQLSAVTAINEVAADGSVISFIDDPECKSDTFNVTLYPNLAAVDISELNCDIRQVNLLSEDGTFCDSRILSCNNDGDVLSADFTNNFADPLGCSILTLDSAPCTDCPIPPTCSGVVDFTDAEVCSDSDTTVLVTSPQAVCNVNPEVINADGTLTIVSIDIYQIDPTGANPPGFLGSLFETVTFGGSACTDLNISYPANQTCDPITFQFSAVTAINEVAADGSVISFVDDTTCKPDTFSVTLYPNLAAVDVSAANCGDRQVDLLAEDGVTVCDSQILVCSADGDELNADFTANYTDPLGCSVLTLTTAACSDCGDCTTPVYAGCVCLARACESNSIYVAEVGADCSGLPVPLAPGSNWTFDWYLDGDLVGTNIGHPYFSPSSTGNYTVIITDSVSCQYWDTAAPCSGIEVNEIIDCSDCGND